MPPPRRRINTFTLRPSWYQLGAYLLISAQIAVFFSCMFPFYSSQVTKITITVLYCTLLGFLVIISFITSFIDPTDPITSYSQLEDIPNPDSSTLAYCSTCYAYCSSSSRHCRICDRCVRDFDHHCVWINNCIGEQNYPHFIIMNWTTLAQMAMFEAAAIVLTVMEDWRGFRSRIIVVWVAMGVYLVFIGMLLYLGALHIHLHIQGLTTYEFFRGRTRKVLPRKVNEEPTQEVVGSTRYKTTL